MPLPQEFHELARAVNNWGRWGDDDELGTLNLITDEVVRRAASCVKTGKRFSLALPLSEEGPQTGVIPGRTNPERTMIAVNKPLLGDPSLFCMSDDSVTMGLQAATHWDSLAHVSYDGRIYNGFGAASIDEMGAARCGIGNVKTLVSRGVLLDVAQVAQPEANHALTPEDLDKAEQLSGTVVMPGDVVLIRTGQMRLLHTGNKNAYAAPSPGPSMQTVPWFRERDVAAVATDNLTFEVFPGEREDCVLPVHLLHLVEMGLTQGQNFDLEALAADCAGDGVYEFLLEATPESFVRGLGGPVNPVAVK